jgi:serine/threonine protein kinase/Tol biopolymer transport system component
MPLSSGTRLGPYEILGILGAGGMGEVYRGRDARLGREVAIKILPIEFRSDPDRLLRFEQEARAAAALNHPHILAVHDIGEHNGLNYIVSELLEGETLREHLSGPSPRRLPARRAVEYATQIARGLAAAHDKGIVHRDLKPENVFVTPDGQVKILDFGVAKLAQMPAAAAVTGAVATDPGVVLGTVGYMAPEQVRGQQADHRADIFAFGAMLYEMLSGRRAFEGQSRADTITAILKEQPQPLPATDSHVTPGLMRIVDRCLEKNPGARFQSTHDLGFALEGLSSHSDAALTPPPSRRRLPAWLPWAIATVATLALLATVALTVTSFRRPPEPLTPIRFQVTAPGTATTMSATANFLALSPDGRHIAFVSSNDAGTPILWVRSLDALEARPIAGTEGARQPFWSPDGRQIGFFASGSLKKIAATGGPAQALSDATAVPTGGTWSRDGVILFSNLTGPIRRVPAAGGVVTMATPMDPARLDQHSFPHFLPDGRRFLYAVRSADPSQSGIFEKSLDSDDVRMVVSASSNIAYVPSGHLVYVRDGVLMAQPFDVDRGMTSGDAVPIAEQVDQFPETGIAAFSASQSGVLVYRGSTDAALSRLLWFDRRGALIGEAGDRRPYRNPRLSPDGKRIAVELVDRVGNRDIWLMDVVRGVPARFTFDSGRDDAPLWSADGRTIFWRGSNGLYAKASSGAEREERLLKEPWIPDDSLPDGSGFLCHPNSPRQISFIPTSGSERAPRSVIEGQAITTQARVSPDGRWVAFASADSGRFEIYVQDFPKPSGRWQISTSGGIQPKWRRDGKELYYLGLDSALMAVPITLGVLAEVGKAHVLFRTRVEPSTGLFWHQYDLSPDGQRFLINTPETVTTPVTVVLNWPGLLKQP